METAAPTTLDFDAFVVQVRPSLARALAGLLGPDDAPDALAEALAYAWEHWERVSCMANPAGYLYRVAQTKGRRRLAPRLPAPVDVGLPDVEPALVRALEALPTTQRTAVWLVYACDWTYADTAVALGTSVSAVGNHLRRGRARLRRALEVPDG